MRFSDSVYLTAAVAHLPLLFGYFRINWNKGHYQFFPLMFLVVAWLIVDRIYDKSVSASNSGQSASLRQSMISMLLIGACGIILGTAVVVQSSFLVVPSIMLLVASWIVGRFGIAGFRTAFPAWLLLAFAIPLPWNLDIVLVNRMQFMASGLASWILDSLGQIHFREGLTLVTAKKQFFTEEACSGIRSLFSSLAAISAFGVLHQFSFQRFLFNWIQVVLWVLVGNAVRIAVVVYVSENWTEAIASGAYHEMLGIGVFALIMLLSLSTNRSIDAFGSSDEEFEDALEDSVVDIEARVIRPEPEPPRSGKLTNWIATACFAFLLLLGARILYAQHVFQPTTFDASALLDSAESDLPIEFEGWTVVEFEKSIRPQTSLLAPNSFIWTMNRGSDTLIVSLDSPYHTFHDLSNCYRGLGWSVESSYDRLPHDGSESFTLLTMTKRGQHGIVLFSANGAGGKPVSRGMAGSRTNSARKNLLLAAGLYDPINDSQQNAALPISQIQVFHESSKPISESEQSDLLRLFLKARQSLLESDRFSNVYDSKGA